MRLEVKGILLLKQSQDQIAIDLAYEATVEAPVMLSFAVHCCL